MDQKTEALYLINGDKFLHQQDQIYGCEEVLLLPDHGKGL